MISKQLATELLGTDILSSLIAARNTTYPLVVLYHGVTKQKNRHGIENYRHKHIDETAFEKQIQWLTAHFEIVPLSTIEKLVLAREMPKKGLCSITFDDGYKNNFEIAYPILKKYHVPATFFITTRFIDGDIALWPDVVEEAIGSIPRASFSVDWGNEKKQYPSRSRADKISSDIEIRNRMKKISSRERASILQSLLAQAQIPETQALMREDYRPMTWENVKELSDNGFQFGAHTENHPILSQLSKEEQESEISGSVEKMKLHGINPAYFAYPNGQPGDWNEDTKNILTKLGFACAWSTRSMRIDTIHDTVFELPRITLDNTNHLNRFRALSSNAIPFVKQLIHKS